MYNKRADKITSSDKSAMVSILTACSVQGPCTGNRICMDKVDTGNYWSNQDKGGVKFTEDVNRLNYVPQVPVRVPVIQMDPVRYPVMKGVDRRRHKLDTIPALSDPVIDMKKITRKRDKWKKNFNPDTSEMLGSAIPEGVEGISDKMVPIKKQPPSPAQLPKRGILKDYKIVHRPVTIIDGKVVKGCDLEIPIKEDDNYSFANGDSFKSDQLVRNTEIIKGLKSVINLTDGNDGKTMFQRFKRRFQRNREDRRVRLAAKDLLKGYQSRFKSEKSVPVRGRLHKVKKVFKNLFKNGKTSKNLFLKDQKWFQGKIAELENSYGDFVGRVKKMKDGRITVDMDAEDWKKLNVEVSELKTLYSNLSDAIKDNVQVNLANRLAESNRYNGN